MSTVYLCPVCGKPHSSDEPACNQVIDLGNVPVTVEPSDMVRVSSMYKLIDVEVRAFQIPPQRIRKNLKAHDLVKLLFEPDEGVRERLWVRVCGPSATAGRYVGQVDNRAVNRTLPRLGDVIEFGPEHVLEFQTSLGAVN